MTRRPGLLSQGAVFGILLLSLAACGGGTAATPTPLGGGSATPPTPAGPTGTPGAVATATPTAPSGGGLTADACTFATAAEVSAAYGLDVSSATPNSDDNYAYCDYASADGDVIAKTYISISAQGRSYMDTVKLNDGEPVSGVGDDAWWGQSFLPGIYFTKGDVLVYASSAGDSTFLGPDQDGVIALAKTMAGRL